MKTFEITFTSDPKSGIYSANLINAESAEQATAYFKTLGNYEVVGCAETQSEPKPGQPVHTVPEGWEAPKEEEETYTTDRDGNKTYGAFNPNRDYFRYNGYGNLVSADYKDYSGQLDKYAVESMSKNRRYIDSIEQSDELAALFDELEEVEE